jgi:hypothetical protein
MSVGGTSGADGPNALVSQGAPAPSSHDEKNGVLAFLDQGRCRGAEADMHLHISWAVGAEGAVKKLFDAPPGFFLKLGGKITGRWERSEVEVVFAQACNDVQPGS